LDSPTQRFSQKELLKNWALTICLANTVKDDADKHDAKVTASAYFEFSRLPVEDLDPLRQLAIKYASQKYSGSVPGDYNIMKCIDLFYSTELDRLATKLIRKGRS